MHPTLVGGAEHWPAVVREAKDMGFTHILLGWPFGIPADMFLTRDIEQIQGSEFRPILQRLASECRALDLHCWIDLVIHRADARGSLASTNPAMWSTRAQGLLDPRTIHLQNEAVARFADEHARESLIAFWQSMISSWRGLGISGLRCHDAESVSVEVWRKILAPARETDPDFQTLAWMPHASLHARASAGKVFDFISWDVAKRGEAVGEYNELAESAHPLAFPDDPFSPGHSGAGPIEPALERQLQLQYAALLADGWLMPMGFEFGLTVPFADAQPDDFAAAKRSGFDLRDIVRAANDASRSLVRGGVRLLKRDHGVLAVARGVQGNPTQLIVINRELGNDQDIDLPLLTARMGRGVTSPVPSLQAGDGIVLPLIPLPPVTGMTVAPPGVRSALEGDRIAIEEVTPTVDAGRFPVKRCVGELVQVEADIFSDGHDVLRADLLWRAADETEWSRSPMEAMVNDRWVGRFPLLRPGRHIFAIEAWWSVFGTFCRDLIKKRDAGVDIALELAEGRLMLQSFSQSAAVSDQAIIEDHLQQLDGPASKGDAILLSDTLRAAMERADPRPHAIGSEEHFQIDADRVGAAFASWYELFPRSITDDAARHGTFRNVISRLPAIKAMGFDVLYFPPIHPIGTSNRKGRNNTLTPSPDDPGSPYAIGSPAGGHDALHPELGSWDDFRALVQAASAHGLELALDFAIQCSPDHPWLREHPDWFQWRPDGSMRYAENPPKKYQDIVNVDFYGPGAIPDLWTALRDVVQFWVDEGVRIFRVDNPHTKPFPFWEWLIADIRSRDPGVLFLAEAFTRPKIMYRLGKVGFSQSYTYFTWRNTKAELTEYLTQLNAEPVRDLFRPHFFVNTPDINPVFLQNSGRAGFLIRAALAATLSGLWGIYSGFELCEASAIPGKEEYLDSEKYEIKPRDWQAPGNIIAEITRLNQIRRDHDALQSHLGVSFYNAFDDNLLYFGKRGRDNGEMILVAVNLDPFNTHSAGIEVPLWEFGLPDTASVAVEDLMRGYRFLWHGKAQTITLDPQDTPFSIWRISAPESVGL